MGAPRYLATMGLGGGVGQTLQEDGRLSQGPALGGGEALVDRLGKVGDAATAQGQESAAHDNALITIFPRIAELGETEDVLAALEDRAVLPTDVVNAADRRPVSE